jgi:ketosteroid isomerase-like protein
MITRTPTRTPQETVLALDDAFNRGDLDAVLNFYDDDAVMVMPDRVVRGKASLRQAFQEILAWQPIVKQERTFALEADGVALFLSRWTLKRSAQNSPPRQFVATAVFRQQPSGDWRCLIDNSAGPAVLGD